MTAYVTTTLEDNGPNGAIIVFENKEQVREWSQKVYPQKVLCSEYNTLNQAKKQAKKLHKMTPWMELLGT